MSMIKVHFFSKALNHMTTANVILPLPKDATANVSEIPVLYLLHGMGDDYSMWMRRTNIESYAIEAGLAVVMPDGGMSCYENMACGGKYAEFILSELPEQIGKMFPISTKREHVYIAGCSMGGCGAIKLATAAPGKYSVCGCLSAGILEYRPEHPVNHEMIRRAFGEDISIADERILRSLETAAKTGPEIRIFHYWGDRDVLKNEALKTRDMIERLGSRYIHYTGIEIPGIHDWKLWDECIRDFVVRLGIQKPAHRLF